VSDYVGLAAVLRARHCGRGLPIVTIEFPDGRPVDRAVGPGDTRSTMPDPEQREARSDFADRGGMVGPYRARYSWAYWAVILAAFALLVVDIFDDGALWNYIVIGLVAIAIVIRPGGIRGPRHAARAEEERRRQV
jgi:hypothetical protein